jgi:hypothetical protein
MGFQLVTKVGMVTRNPRILAELAQGFLRGVVANNQLIIRVYKRQGKPIPKLYESGVRYEREPWTDREEFADILTVLRRGWGDCDDLCAWRVAELRESGEPDADIRVYWRPVAWKQPKKPMLMHVQVRRADGSIEDPSRFLGL